MTTGYSRLTTPTVVCLRLNPIVNAAIDISPMQTEDRCYSGNLSRWKTLDGRPRVDFEV
jgi:hypothetical protein